MKPVQKMAVLLNIVGLLCNAVSFAGTAEEWLAEEKERREKNLEFDPGVVEGFGKEKTDYDNLISKEKRIGKKHLYRRNIRFDRERDEALREVRFSQ